MGDGRQKKLARKAERQARRASVQVTSPRPFTDYILTRWRCARRCGAGEWTPRYLVPQNCPSCGAGIDVEN